MNKIIITLLILSAGAQATDRETMMETCGGISELAAEIMTSRQQGVQMRKMMELADGRQPDETMIIQAFSIHKMRVPENQREASDQFANRWYLDCVRYMETKK